MANFFDQFDQPETGGNYFDQFDAPEQKKSQDVPGQISIPGIGKPSIIGMIKGLASGIKSAATLPGDVYAGKVDPLSDEGIRRSMDMAALTQLPMRSVASRPGTAPLPAAEIKSAATTAYDSLRDATRSIALQPEHSQLIAKDIADFVGSKGPRATRAPLSHAEIKGIGESVDLGDLVDRRKNLMDIKRTGVGEDVGAAKMAITRLDSAIDRIVPGTVTKLKEADKNYAIAAKAAEREQTLADAIQRAGTTGTGGNEGNVIRQAFRPLLEKGRDKHMTPEVRGAIDRTVNPGAANALRPLAAFDPTHSKIGAMFAAGAAWPTAGQSLALMPAGYTARAMYDRILRKRAAAISEAMRREAPASLAQPGYRPEGLVGLSMLPQPTAGLLPTLNYEGYPY